MSFLNLPADNVGRGIENVVLSQQGMNKKTKSLCIKASKSLYNLIKIADAMENRFGKSKKHQFSGLHLSNQNLWKIIQTGTYAFPPGFAMMVGNEGGTYTVAHKNLPQKNGKLFSGDYDSEKRWLTTRECKHMQWEDRMAVVGAIVGLHIPSISQRAPSRSPTSHKIEVCVLVPAGEGRYTQHFHNAGPGEIDTAGGMYIAENSLASAGRLLAIASWGLSRQLKELGWVSKKWPKIPNYASKSGMKQRATELYILAPVSSSAVYSSKKKKETFAFPVTAPFHQILSAVVRTGGSTMCDGQIESLMNYVVAWGNVVPNATSPICPAGDRPMPVFEEYFFDNAQGRQGSAAKWVKSKTMGDSKHFFLKKIEPPSPTEFRKKKRAYVGAGQGKNKKFKDHDWRCPNCGDFKTFVDIAENLERNYNTKKTVYKHGAQMQQMRRHHTCQHSCGACLQARPPPNNKQSD